MTASKVLIAPLFLVFACYQTAHSQQNAPSRSPASDLKSTDWGKRQAEYGRIKHNPNLLQRPDVRLTLFDLLDFENHIVGATLESENSPSIGEKYGEGYAEYVGDLAGTAADLADWHDPRQVCILAQSSYNIGSAFAIDLAAKGGPVVAPCLLKLAKGNMYVRDQSIPVLMQISAITKDLSPSIREQIRQVVLAGLKDSSEAVRIHTVEAAARFGTRDLIPNLEEVAQSDPYSRLKNGQTYFDIRETAAKAIISIRGRAAKTPNP